MTRSRIGTAVARSAEQRTVVVTLGLAQTLAWASSYYVPAVLAAPMAIAFDRPASHLFAAFSAALVVSAVLGPRIGRAVDRHGGRNVLLASNLVLAAGLIVLGLAPDFPWLVGGWLLMGVGMALGLYETAFATLAGRYGRGARGPITGVGLIAGFASTVGWPLTAVLADAYGWRGACFAWAALQLLIALPLHLSLPSGRAAGAEVAAAAQAGPASLPAPYAGPLLALVFAANLFVAGGMSAHLPRLFADLGATPAAAIGAAALVGPAQVLGRLAEFGLLHRVSPFASARMAALCHPLGAALLGGLGAGFAAPFAVLHGLGNGVLTIARGTLPLEVFGATGYGARQGWLVAPGRFLMALAPLIFGLLLDGPGVVATLWVTGGVSVAAWLALVMLRRARPVPAGAAVAAGTGPTGARPDTTPRRCGGTAGRQGPECTDADR